ncbi:MAG: PGPGW domain-containing protein [Phycisphaerales bacterium]
MLEWLKQHPGLVVSGGLSVVLLVAGILVAPGAVARLPKDFFTRKDHKPSLWLNIVGWVLVVAGVAMLILPGPGAVALLAGIVLADFPGKRRFLRWFLAQGRVFEGLNRIRAKRDKPPLQKP